VIFFQTIFGFYGEFVNEAWSWFLPTVFPTLSLMTAVFVSDVTDKNMTSRVVDRFLYLLTISLSFLYLISVSMVFILSPLTNAGSIELMKLSNFGLGPLQGIVIACMGIFFIKKGKE
jgi:hypothetical protein